MVGRRIGYLLALCAAAVFYCFYDQWFSGYLLALLLALPWLSLACSLPGMVTTRLEAQLPGRILRSAEGNLTLRCGCRFPAPGCTLRLILADPVTGARTVRRVRLTRTGQFTAPVPTAHCGVCLCRAERIRVYDCLGLFALGKKPQDLGKTEIWPIPTAPEPRPRLHLVRPDCYVPKPGGGFAEQQELRGYRPGDSLRSMHWKLTAKLDAPVVREPMERQRDPVVLTLDLPRDPGGRDEVLDRLAWLCRMLLERELSFEIRYLDGRSGCVVSRPVSNLPEGEKALRELLAAPPAEGSMGALAVQASWRYHIAPGKGAEG